MVHHTKQIRTYFFSKVRSDLFFIYIYRITTKITNTAVDISIWPFNNIVGADTRPVFYEKIAVDQRFFNATLHYFGCFFQFHGA